MIPNKVKVAGVKYVIKEIENMEIEFNQLGQILYTKGIIKIDDGMSLERKEQVFVHELLHGIFYEAGFEEQDEDMINRVGIVLYQVLKDNRFSFGSEKQIEGMTMNY
ncbi:ImmA/IrrE family metallo-endopeptidase [Cytobacillus praedii]|uniref:ImmA/IrrE family metallo-endopeptidase n=1 Tax=Cytobacillus praedii TaxID=1742358 RepID=UPI003F805238